jgi:hypothetical protein
MTSRFLVLTGAIAVSIAASAACSSTPQSSDFGTPSGDDNSGGDGGSASPPGNGSSGGSSGAGSSSGTVVPYGLDAAGDAYIAPIHYSDAAAQKFYDTSIPDAEQAQSATITITPFVIPAGGEVYMCQLFANPFGGQDADVVEIDGQMSTGSHHFFIFDMTPATASLYTTTIENCPAAGLEFYPYLYLSQQPNWDVTYPEANMGYPLAGTNSLMMNVHFLNATSEDVTAQATATIKTAKPGVVTTLVGNLFLNNQAISVPPTPMSSPPVAVTASTTPGIPYAYNLLQSWSHMHKYATKFTTTLGNAATPFYTETDWNAPQTVNYWPNPIQVPQGTAFTWTCEYYNPTGATMTFGDSAVTSDMCIYFGQFYPALPISSGGPDFVNVITGF